MKRSRQNRKLHESASEISRHIRKLGVQPDFTIISGDTLFMVHSTVLAPASNHFLQLFMDNPMNSFKVLMSPKVTPLDVEHILTYIYQASVKVTSDHKEGFLEAAKQLRIDSLIDVTSDKMASDIISSESFSQSDGASRGTFTVRNNSMEEKSKAPVRLGPAEATVHSNLLDNNRFLVDMPPAPKPRELTPFTHPEAEEDSLPTNDTVKRILENISTSTSEATKVEAPALVSATKDITFSMNENHLELTSLRQHDGEKEKIRKTKSNEKPLVQKLLGRPLLSSTKLCPNDPQIPDKTDNQAKKFKLALKKKARLIESVESDVINETDNFGKENIASDRIAKNIDHQRQPLGVVSENDGSLEQVADTSKISSCPFRIADLVEGKKSLKEASEQSNKPSLPTNNVSSSPSTTDTEQEVPCKSQTSGYAGGEDEERKFRKMQNEMNQNGEFKIPCMKLQPGQPRLKYKRLGGLSNRPASCNSTSFLDVTKGIMRRILKKARVPQCIRPTDESSFGLELAYRLKRKLPLAKRRRKVAANRPELLTTTLNTSAIPSPKRKPKFKKLYGRK